MISVATYFKNARLAKGLTVEALAQQIGYPNPGKAARRIARFERDGSVKDEMLARMADALGIDFPTVEELIAKECRQPQPCVIRRLDDGRYLTPAYLRWSSAEGDAQRCDLAEAEAIKRWQASIGIRATVSKVQRQGVYDLE